MPVFGTDLRGSSRSNHEWKRTKSRSRRTPTPLAFGSFCPGSRNGALEPTEAELTLETEFDSVFYDGPQTAPLRNPYYELQHFGSHTSCSAAPLNRPRTRSACALNEFSSRSQTGTPKSAIIDHYESVASNTGARRSCHRFSQRTLQNAMVADSQSQVASASASVCDRDGAQTAMSFASGCNRVSVSAADCISVASSTLAMRNHSIPSTNGSEQHLTTLRKRNRLSEKSNVVGGVESQDVACSRHVAASNFAHNEATIVLRNELK